ncbi:hypothetical protein BOTNAR_0066g00180 [Botryotinia narcissicola]|uniref:Uncharacterized protein n=1 Tax=Botryotinia narcissicola TaxID=278944 RepID=A0A4Z1IXI8_9HELO|nr:hypothetical protein BOTNAR_0066g00180 [Botryotinia narcissicola]
MGVFPTVLGVSVVALAKHDAKENEVVFILLILLSVRSPQTRPKTSIASATPSSLRGRVLYESAEP